MKSDAMVQEEEARERERRLRDKEHINLMVQISLLKLSDAGKRKGEDGPIARKINCLFEQEFKKPDFLVRLGFFLIEIGLYPERFQARID